MIWSIPRDVTPQATGFLEKNKIHEPYYNFIENVMLGAMLLTEIENTVFTRVYNAHFFSPK